MTAMAAGSVALASAPAAGTGLTATANTVMKRPSKPAIKCGSRGGNNGGIHSARRETYGTTRVLSGDRALCDRLSGGGRTARDLLRAVRQPEGRAGGIPAWRTGRRLQRGASPLLRSRPLS